MLKKGWFKPRTKPVNTRSELLLAVNEGDAEKAAYLRYTSSQEHLQEAFSASLTNGDETIANILFESVSPLSTHLRIACEVPLKLSLKTLTLLFNAGTCAFLCTEYSAAIT